MLRRIWHGKIKGDVKPFDLETKSIVLESLDIIDLYFPGGYSLDILTNGGRMKVYASDNNQWSVNTTTEYIHPPYSYFLNIIKFSGLRKAGPNNYLEKLRDVEIYIINGTACWEDLAYSFYLKSDKINVSLKRDLFGEVIEEGSTLKAMERCFDIISAKRGDVIRITPYLREENIDRELWPYTIAELKDGKISRGIIHYNIPKWTYQLEVNKRLREIDKDRISLNVVDEKGFETQLISGYSDMFKIKDKLFLKLLSEKEKPKDIIKSYFDFKNMEFRIKTDEEIHDIYEALTKKLFGEYEKYRSSKPVGAAYLAVSKVDKKLNEEIEKSVFLKEFRKEYWDRDKLNV